MPFRISVDARESYLFVIPVGEVSTESILDLGKFIRRECDEQQMNAAIVDCAGMTGALSVAELFSVTPEFVRAVGFSTKVAYINPPKECAPEDDRFCRTVAQNRGGSLEAFDSEEDAKIWFAQ